MRVYRFLSILLVSLLLLTFFSALPVHASPSWNVQNVDVNGANQGSNGYCPIVVDSNNTSHIVYTDTSIGNPNNYIWYEIPSVMYASWTSSGWSTQKIAGGDAFSLVLDANGNPHVLYGIPLGALYYASWTGTNWASQIVDPNNTGFGSLALDSAGNPHVAYTDGTTVKYASWTGSNWNIQTVDTSSEEIPFSLSLALDQNNTPYIMYGYKANYMDNSTGIN